MLREYPGIPRRNHKSNIFRVAHLQNETAPEFYLADVPDIFYFFCSGLGKGGAVRANGRGGGRFLLEIRGREGGQRRGGRHRRWEHVCKGGLNIFLSGPKLPANFKLETKNGLKMRESQGPLNGGVSNGGVSLFCPFPSFFVLFCPFWDFPDFSGIFPICSGMVRGFSRLVLFLFLGLLRAPLVTRIAATSKSQIASDCNRNSKKSLRLRKHPLKPNLWTREPPVLCGFYSVFRSATWVWKPPRIRCDYNGVILNRSDFLAQCYFCDCDTAILLRFLREKLAISKL